MNAPKQTSSKSSLLEWLNSTLKPVGHSTARVEQLGTGVAYLLLLNSMHPGILQHQKYYRKPGNEYEYHANLRVLNSLLAKLGVDKAVDVEKLSKLKMQDNLTLLQWFYTYHNHLSNATISSHKPASGDTFGNKCNNEDKIIKIKAPQKLNLSMADKSKKMDIEQPLITELQTVGSASKRIHQIQSILQSDSIPAHEAKLQKIMQILKLKHGSQCTPAKMGRISEHEEQMYVDENYNRSNSHEGCAEEKKEVTYVKCRKLQQKCNEYIKTSILRKNQETPRSEPSRQARRLSVKLSDSKQIFEYCPHPNQTSHHQSITREKQTNAHSIKPINSSIGVEALTKQTSLEIGEQDGHESGQADNSILLQSDRKSVQSETNLLLPNDEDYRE